MECDDGNLLNGDGCNADCKVESGYKCTTPRDGGADICVDIIAPTATLGLKTAVVLEVAFSETVSAGSQQYSP